MCMSAPKPQQDNSAEIARKREEERQAQIRAGREKIDTTFARFDDPYFKGIEQNYVDYYNPQLEDQFNKARQKLIYRLGTTGNLNSGVGADQLGELRQSYQTNRSSIAGQALDAVKQARAQIEDARSDLYSQNTSAADPAAIGVQAASRAGTLALPQSYNPLGDLFATFLNNASVNVAAERQGYPGYKTGLFAPKSSAKVVA